MKGNVTLDVRAGRANEICGQYEFADKSIIRGDLHIIAGAEKYENTDRTLRLNGNWPITGAGYRFAASPFEKGTYQIDGNVVIDTYENVWGWDKYGTIGGDIPEIYAQSKARSAGISRSTHMVPTWRTSPAHGCRPLATERKETATSASRPKM